MALVCSALRLVAAVAFSQLLRTGQGHGRLSVPWARSGGIPDENGVNGAGPGSVHAYDGSSHVKYQHGVCGDPAAATQTWNMAGRIQATYTAGTVVEFQVIITAHHVGFFAFEICEDASKVSEACFMKHRLLREGCTCSCGSDSTNSCAACDTCRRWWKPLMPAETMSSVSAGYAGPVLSGDGTLRPYQFTMRYVIPAGIKTSHGVLRWHYMTTNSCTTSSSAPEEFWNCADIAIRDSSGNLGPAIAVDNASLASQSVPNLMPLINAGTLTGVYSGCPVDTSRKLIGVGTQADYSGACGQKYANGTFERCKDLNAAPSGSGMNVDCTNPPGSGIICESECGPTWFQCSGLIANPKPVPAGTLCRGSAFVLASECAGSAPPPTTAPSPPVPVPMPAPTPTPGSTTVPPPPAPSPATTTVRATTAVRATTKPAAASTTKTAASKCGACKECLWSTGTCYTGVTSAYCLAWAANTWCGPAALEQADVALQANIRQHNFRGNALLQDGVLTQRGDSVAEEL